MREDIEETIDLQIVDLRLNSQINPKNTTKNLSFNKKTNLSKTSYKIYQEK